MKLSELLRDIPVLETNADPELEITGVSYDSRETTAGHLFVAVTGFQTDGHDYIPKAAASGAVCVLCERKPEAGIPFVRVADSRAALAILGANWFGHPAERLTVIGVTGTNGKTTVTFLLKSVLERVLGAKVGLIGTIQNMIGDEVLHTERTTPESFELQGLFAEMLEKGCTHVVMEVSSHALCLHRVDCIPFAVGAFTNLTEDHLDFHKTMEAYRKAKAILFDRCRIGVFNADDEAVRRTMAEAPCEKLTSSAKGAADLYAANAVLGSDHVAFDAHWQGQVRPVRIEIPGGFTVYNALTVLGCALALGLDFETAADALAEARSVKGRVEVVPTPGKDYTVLIDYAHTPDALENVLRSVRGFCKGRVSGVFGCGGDRDAAKRPIMGEIGVRYSDLAVITSDNPRTEVPGAIIQDILAGVKGLDRPYLVVENRRAAIARAMHEARKDDVIVLCGKGHETYQEINHEKFHLDEREEVARVLASDRAAAQSNAITFAQAADWCGGEVLPEFADRCFAGLRNDTRELSEGMLFAALRGEKADGHDYIPDAMKRGASGALGTRQLPGIPMIVVPDVTKAMGDIARAYRRTLPVKVVGVTGSVGKTTTKEMIAAVLSEGFRTQCTPKNYNNDIGVPITLLSLRRDTEFAVVEMGLNHRGEISYLTQIACPDAAVITKIGESHIGNLGSRENICREKLDIIDGMGPDGLVILNGDDDLLRVAQTGHRTLTFGFGADCSLRGEELIEDKDQIRFTAVGLDRRFPLTVPVAGRHNAMNALSAALTGLALGLSPAQIAAGLADFRNTGDRQRTETVGGYTLIIDCYNAGPDSMQAALSVLAGRSDAGRRIAVLGDMLELDDYAPEAHRKVGRLAAESADLVLACGPMSYALAQAAGEKGRWFESQDALLEALRAEAKPGDVLLFKASHGMHLEQLAQKFKEEI